MNLAQGWNLPTIIQLSIMFLGILGIGWMNFTLARQNRRTSESMSESTAYMNILDGILELKKWVVDNDQVLNRLGAEALVVAKLKAEAVIKDEKDLMERCIFFYQLEKIYLLSEKSPMKVHKNRSGFTKEIDMWLTIPGMEVFFENFVMEYGTHSQAFISYVDLFYKTWKEAPQRETVRPVKSVAN